MKRCSIVIHSVSGNVFIIGSYLTDCLKEKGVDARLYRVEDTDLHILANKLDSVNQYYEDILELPVCHLSTLKKSDMVILGCPTRFGNMSAEMKAFLDSTYEMSEERALEGTLFGCFTGCPHTLSEGAHALDSLVYWAQIQAMIHIPFGIHTDVAMGYDQPAAGIVHLEGKENLIRPSALLAETIETYAATVASYLS
ncbi:MAG: NAD(P)H-dependent oxidoreductase [Spirochaetales bacterium]|nr:NAD(P)H-dependent oxidoreductase [Spirochaetales bacterium]